MNKPQELKKKSAFAKFQDLTQSKGYKTFMAYIYGFGASIVMIGAYFKLTHIPGADIMLGIGLGTEAIIFFLSAFEPQHLEYKWDNVFVELDEEWDGKTRTAMGGSTNAQGKIEDGFVEKMFDKINIDSRAFDKIGEGLNKLANNASQIADLSNAVAATNRYTEAMEKANKTVSEVSASYAKANEKLAASLGNIDFSALDADMIKKIANSMQSLNSIYELQLQSSKQTAEVSEKLTKSMQQYLEGISASAKNTEQVNSQLTQLSTRLTALNNVYGGMLSAMNIKA